MTFTGMLCYCVCARACVFVPVHMRASVHGLFVVKFSPVVSLFVCVSLCGQGSAWINVWVKVSVCTLPSMQEFKAQEMSTKTPQCMNEPQMSPNFTFSHSQ